MNESIQLVNGGLNLDADEHFQPENTIRYGLNGRIFHLGGGNYTWKNMEGNEVAFSICEPTFTPIGWCVIRNEYTASGSVGVVKENLIVFSAKDGTGADNDGEIGVVEFDSDGLALSGYTAIYHHAKLNFTTENPIECFGYFENDNIQRVY